MAKIRFWRWQQTDELGMPCPTRFRLTEVRRKEPEHLDHHSWSLQRPNLEQSQTDTARATPPK